MSGINRGHSAKPEDTHMATKIYTPMEREQLLAAKLKQNEQKMLNKALTRRRIEEMELKLQQQRELGLDDL